MQTKEPGKSGKRLKVFYSSEFYAKIRKYVRIEKKIDVKLEACRYGKHHYACKGCTRKGFLLMAFDAHIRNHNNRKCFKAVTGKDILRTAAEA